MSLVRLLSAGKSLVGAQDLEGKYRLPPNRSVPEFGSSKNPFLGPTAAEPERVGTLQAPSTTEVQSSPSRTPPASSQCPSVEVTPLTPVPQKRSEQTAHVERTGFWSRTMAPLSKVTRLFKRDSRNVIPAFPKVPVQGELSLDRVKVLRNDLSDTDLEVVPAQPSGNRGKTGNAATGKKLVQSEPSETNG